jgi:hypothetical protein
MPLAVYIHLVEVDIVGWILSLIEKSGCMPISSSLIIILSSSEFMMIYTLYLCIIALSVRR